jgi:chromosome partitioning protein
VFDCSILNKFKSGDVQMFTISIVNQKGGSGKSTLAECLAVAAFLDGKASAILDLDPQGTAYAWSKRREETTPPVLSVTQASFKDEWQRLKDAGAEWVIIDTPARLQDTVMHAADIADLVIIPAKATIKDLERVEDSIKLACVNGAKPTVVVLNQVRAQGARSEEAEAAIKAQRFPVMPVRIGLRVAFEDSDVSGQTPQETEPSGKAAEEIGQLYKSVSKLLNNFKSSKVQNFTSELLEEAMTRKKVKHG